MPKPTFQTTPAPVHPLVNSVLVRTCKHGGYWGRGETVQEAIRNATWIGSQDEVYVTHCDEAAYVHEITGDLYCNARGPVYKGKITANKRDVRDLSEALPARLPEVKETP